MSAPQDNAKTDERPFIPVRIAVMTVSDTRTLETDRSGQVISDLIAAAGHQLSGRTIVKDDIGQIRRVARNWLKRDDIDVILSTGGTGLTGRDVTVELSGSCSRRRSRASRLPSTWCHGRRSDLRPSSRAPPPASPRASSSSACPAHREPAATLGGILRTQLDYRHLPATSSRSCRGSRSTCSAAKASDHFSS